MNLRVTAFDPDKCFPITGGKSVLWSDAETAYKVYSGFFGSGQSLKRLAERGGFHPDEFAYLWRGINPLHGKGAKPCPECHGTGEVIQSDEGGIWFKCGVCIGAGTVLPNTTVEGK